MIENAKTKEIVIKIKYSTTNNKINNTIIIIIIILSYYDITITIKSFSTRYAKKVKSKAKTDENPSKNKNNKK